MRTTLIRTGWAALALGGLIIVCYLFVDRPAAEAALSLRGTAWHAAAKGLSQVANHLFFNVLVAAGLIAGAVDGLANGLTNRSRGLLYLCLSVACAMLVGDVFKELFGRARPPLLFNKGVYGFFPLAGGGMHASFPSGHTLRIFSAMTALGVLLPRLRVPALALATAVGISRVLALRHYPSDVLCGAFIGVTAALWGWRLVRNGTGRPAAGPIQPE
ncbi:PAP2 superfamily protein [Pseudodesulfovibrio hydrargyri]|uniref:PAP2 superfamily protein n=1 Tax=Pseudodesulfovibrio hydrargyri TaxID=2125990 RepID=A0A1J5MVY4_9BACT|nr:phosphatase PAP2 family protein [Pseudodesulfovibrio hydrargyri]OIQ50725.1 PAP2 superfamily protein [Pseudodesulfovibrio hydrargyri]